MIETTQIRSTEQGTAAAVVERVRARARLQCLWMERLWSEGRTSLDQGLAITPGEVRRILADSAVQEERYELFLAEPESSALLYAAEVADEALAADGTWQQLSQTFDLTAPELDLLSLLAAVELEPKLGRVLAYLADDASATTPTLLSAATLFGWASEDVPSMQSLLRWRLARTLADEPAWRAQSSWQVDEAFVRSLRAERWVDPSLESWTQTIEPFEVDGLPLLYPEAFDEVLGQVRAALVAQLPAELAITGPEGFGRSTLAARVAASLGRSLLVIRASAKSGGPVALDDLIRAVRSARATNAMVYWRDPEHIPANYWSELRGLAELTLVGSRTAPAKATFVCSLPPLDTAKRVELWRHLSPASPPAMILSQRLTPAEIVLAAQTPDEADMRAALARAVPRSSELVNILPCPYTWDDLVIAPELQRTLRDFESQIRLRWEVYEDWGFVRLTPVSQGISALFGGPSGTGKTMAAQVLARSLNMTLYRVDLAGVVNKYIGETEKRLREVFDSCERSGGLLFFDEADALFGARTQVKDAHDRFANIEIDYLLQRIEQFDGIAILATNRKNDVDQAFLRRLRFVVDFLPPGKLERFALWQKALPKRAPSGEEILGEIDFQGLADNLDFNGAQIKSIVLGAAFLARSEGTKITMQHLELASSRELAKQGLRLRTPFAKAVSL